MIFFDKIKLAGPQAPPPGISPGTPEAEFFETQIKALGDQKVLERFSFTMKPDEKLVGAIGISLLEEHMKIVPPDPTRTIDEVLNACPMKISESEAKLIRSQELLGRPWESYAKDRGSGMGILYKKMFAQFYAMELGFKAAFAIQNGWCLLTDAREHAEAILDLKVKVGGDDKNTDEATRADQELNAKANEILHRLLVGHLPVLLTKSYEDILWLREKLGDYLDPFRISMRALATKIKSTPWEAEFEREVVNEIASSVEPKIEELKRKLDRPGADILKRLLADSKSYITTGATLAISLAAGAPIEVSGPLSIAASVASASIDSAHERKEAMRSCEVAFLLAAEKALKS